MTKYKIDVATDQNDLFSKTVEIIIEQINHFLSIKKRVQISLSGGSTPAEVYRLLSREDIDWSRVDIFLGDERWVDTSDKSSNALMINKTLLSSRLVNTPAKSPALTKIGPDVIFILTFLLAIAILILIIKDNLCKR